MSTQQINRKEGEPRQLDAVVIGAGFSGICLGIQLKRRRIISKTQGIIDGRIVFEAEIIGMTMRE